MTDTIIDDDMNDVPSSANSRTSSSITTTRRPMFIETEVRTDTVTTRRMAAAANRSVNDVLENTRSPNDGRQPTSYTYAQSSAYAPTTRSTSYDIPAMARRNLHSGNQNSDNSTTSLPAQIYSNVRSQFSNGVAAIRDRLSNLTGHGQGDENNGLTNSPSRAGTRYSRSSSQSSATGSRQGGYNLRSRPVHSTPREGDNDQPRRTSHGKGRKDNQQQGEIDEEDNQDNDQDENKNEDNNNNDNTVIYYLKKVFNAPAELFDSFWSVLKRLPLWLLIPLLILFAVYTLPFFACKPFQYYPIAKVNDVCRGVHRYTNSLTKKTYDFTRRHTYERGLRNLKQAYGSAHDLKDSIRSSLTDIYYSLRSSLSSSVGDVKQKVADAVESTTENAKGYCDAGVQKMNSLLEELKHEREKYLGARHTLKPDEEQEFESMIRRMIDEYAADETGQADYALEANGAKIVDTRCSEYTDEPRQNVVKFLGIPIVHMSKHPDIIIKPGRMPGQCFPFKGERGSIVIRLAVPVVPTEFVLEHLSKSISIVGHINTAPNNFTVYALKDKHDKEGIVLGRYFYDAENGPALQRFKPQIPQVTQVEYIELQVTSNWGNPAYTCIYRFRVHGDMQTVIPSAPPAT